MPITKYLFENRIFFAVESDHLSGPEGEEWARRLKAAAESSAEPIVALVDARTVTSIALQAERAFIAASRFPNLLGVVVATNLRTTLQATTIGILGQRGYTRIFRTLEEAQSHVVQILKQGASNGE